MQNLAQDFLDDIQSFMAVSGKDAMEYLTMLWQENVPVSNWGTFINDLANHPDAPKIEWMFSHSYGFSPYFGMI